MKMEEVQKSLTEMSSIIDSIKLRSLSKSTEIDVLSSELEVGWRWVGRWVGGGWVGGLGVGG